MATPLPPDAETIRARVEQHERELGARDWLTPADVAKRLRVHVDTIRVIPFDELPFIEMGLGVRRKRRRYAPDDVTSYEEALRQRARLSRRSA